MKRLSLKVLIAALSIFTCGVGGAAQSTTNLETPRKVDSYGAIACDDAMARLDSFAIGLQNEPEAHGYIVVYPERNGLAGKFQSYVDFASDYLKKTRGISSERLTTLSGEYRDVLTTELWLAPAKASLPVTTMRKEESKQRARKFDEGFADYSTNQGTQELSTYDLCPLGAVYFRAFAEQLRAEPNSRGIVIIHLEYGKRSGRARTMTRLLREKMVKENSVRADRIVIRYGQRRRVPGVELWIIQDPGRPASHVTPASPALMAQLSEINLAEIGPIAPKGRVQDRAYNQLPLIEQLISHGKLSIPYLIGKLEDETSATGHVMDFWSEVRVGDIALLILTNFFTDSTLKRATIPGATWDELLGRANNKNLTGEQVLRLYIARNGRKNIRQRWQQMWEEYKEKVIWDENCRCFEVTRQ